MWTFLYTFQASFPVKYKSIKQKMTGLFNE